MKLKIELEIEVTGDCCSFCAKDEDLRKIQENKEHVRTQMQELQEEIERRLKNESPI